MFEALTTASRSRRPSTSTIPKLSPPRAGETKSLRRGELLRANLVRDDPEHLDPGLVAVEPPRLAAAVLPAGRCRSAGAGRRSAATSRATRRRSTGGLCARPWRWMNTHPGAGALRDRTAPGNDGPAFGTISKSPGPVSASARTPRRHPATRRSACSNPLDQESPHLSQPARHRAEVALWRARSRRPAHSREREEPRAPDRGVMGPRR